MTKSEYLDKLIITIVAEDSVLYESPYWGQHGISFFIEACKNKIQKNILVDVGQSHEALLHNMKLLNIDPGIIDAMVLTHCHYDHTQGVVDLLRAIGKKDIPVIAHPSIFKLNFIVNPYLRHVGIMSNDAKERIEKSGGTLYLTGDPLQMMPGLMTTGEVKRQTDFEEVGIALKTITEDHRIVEDNMQDDISLIANLNNQGIVLISGCSHAGIVNIVKQSIEMTGVQKVRAVLGGLHLVEAPMERIRKTAEALSTFDISLLAAGHCTGFKAQVQLFETFREKFLPLQTGMKFEF